MAAIRSSLFCEFGAPPRSGQQIDEEFGVEEAAGVGAIIRTTNLAHDLLDFRKAGEHATRRFATTACPQ